MLYLQKFSLKTSTDFESDIESQRMLKYREIANLQSTIHEMDRALKNSNENADKLQKTVSGFLKLFAF